MVQEINQTLPFRLKCYVITLTNFLESTVAFRLSAMSYPVLMVPKSATLIAGILCCLSIFLSFLIVASVSSLSQEEWVKATD